MTSVHWKSANEVLVSTYGRGLWRLQGQIQVPHMSLAAMSAGGQTVHWLASTTGEGRPTHSTTARYASTEGASRGRGRKEE